ncbi:beta strand repeat-containing protein [Halorubrum rutilum]|uniref:Beta strand repeat-containing protein n=1 Tax=Halorubrum rutilum TaxID=1364933 RepID=A0ABD6APH1_9EURY|nr:GLUG motif-containing protein [Halorubrum rutilum]
MTTTRKQASAIIWSALIITAMIGGYVAVGGAAAADHSVNSVHADVDPSALEGDGTEANPYQITNVSELQAMEDDLDAYYELTSDIDASNTAEWNNGSGFDPVGEFTGTLHGNGYNITGLTIDRADEFGVGLFSRTDRATVTAVSLINVTVTGRDRVGALIGGNDGGTVQNVTARGSVSGTDRVGGLIGTNRPGSVVNNSYATTTVTGAGQDIGGLVGTNGRESVIDSSYATGAVTGDDTDVGGLAGRNIGRIIDSHATGDVEANINGSQSRSGNRVGGLTGYNQGNIVNSYATGTVTGSSRVGGLVGVNFDYNDTETVVRNSYATGDVTGDNGSIGGLVGGNFEGAPVGDLVPSLEIRVTNSYATGDVSGDINTGGLVGYNNGSVDQSFAVGDVEGDSDVGGLVGQNDEQVEKSYWDTDATGQPTSAGSATGLTTAEMEGEAAQVNMDGFDFEAIWMTTESYPTLRDLPNRPTQGEQSVASIIAPPDASYTPSAPYTIGTFHNATGTIDSNDVGIRLVNATADNGTVVVLNDAVPVTGNVNTTIPAGSLSGNVTIAAQLYNLSSQQVVASDTVNLTAETSVEQPGPSVTFDDQTVENGSSTVTVDSATLPDGGFVAIHSTPVVPDYGTAVDSVVGVSEYLENGTSENITVTLDEPVTESQTLVAMPHLDTNGNETYDFVTSNGSADGPYIAGGEAVTDSASVTVDAGSPLDGAAGEFDNDGDGTVSASELGDAVNAFGQGNLSAAELGEVVNAFGQS